MKLTDYPSLRILIPFAGGVLLSSTIGDTQISLSLLSQVLALLLIVTVLLLFTCKKLPRLYGLSLWISIFVVGVLLSCYNNSKVKVIWPAERSLYSGMLTDYPVEKEKSYRLDLELIDSLYGGRNIILYVPKDSAVLELSPGELIVFRGVVKEPSNESMENDFDYASYLYRKGVSGTLWVNSSSWKVLPDSFALSPLKIKAVKYRKRILDMYREWGLEGDVLAVVAAVTVGYKDELTDELRTVYSTSGASHVLAVSGLHVGILFSILSLLFPLFTGRRDLRWVKEIILMAIMWSYAFFIGLPYSITRSLIMFSILVLCRSIGRENSSLNALAFAALVILVADTNAIYDIGFQLSFSAVLAILLFEPRISELFSPENVVIKYIWGIISVSLAAQIGTAPLIMYNFSNFSTYFLITNIVAIPLIFLVVFVAVLMVLFSFIEPLRDLIIRLLDCLVNMMNSLLSQIANLPFSSLTIENLSSLSVYCIYISMIMCYLYLTRKQTSYLVRLLFVVACWSITELCIQLNGASLCIFG